jgi:hypothetical protein
MENMSIVKVLQCQDALNKPCHHLIFWNRRALLLELGNLLRKVSTLTEIHKDAEPARITEAFSVMHNVRMREGSQKLTFLHSILHFFL